MLIPPQGRGVDDEVEKLAGLADDLAECIIDTLKCDKPEWGTVTVELGYLFPLNSEAYITIELVSPPATPNDRIELEAELSIRMRDALASFHEGVSEVTCRAHLLDR